MDGATSAPYIKHEAVHEAEPAANPDLRSEGETSGSASEHLIKKEESLTPGQEEFISADQRTPSPVLYRPPWESPILDIFVERFVDAFAPNERLDCGSSSAIREAASVRMFSPLLQNAFHAVSTSYFGQFLGDWRVVSAGRRSFLGVVSALQRALYHPVQSRSEGVLATAILLMAYESLQSSTENALRDRCIGALKLIEYRGPYNHMFGIEHICFTELLPYWVSTALMLRTPTFLAREEWKTIPWRSRGAKDIMEHLLEQMVDLPAILANFDGYTDAATNRSTSAGELADQQARLWASITEFEIRLRHWKVIFADTYPSGQPVEVQSQGQDPFPIFQRINPFTLEITTPTTLIYPDPQLARTLCMYYTGLVLLGSVDTRPINAISQSEQVDFACLICRSMEYYIRNVPGNMINRMAFPLRVAYDALPEGGVERRFVAETFQLVQRKNYLRSWGKLMVDVSPKKQV